MQSGEKTALERLYLPVTSRQYGAPRTEGDRQYLQNPEKAGLACSK